MNEVTKPKLTPEIAAFYFQNYTEPQTDFGCFPWILFLLFPPLGLLLLLMNKNSQTPDTSSVTQDMLVIYEDQLVNKSYYDNSGDGEDDYILTFSRSGQIYTKKSGKISGTPCPDYNLVHVGQKFYVAAVRGLKSSPIMFFPQNLWRMDAPDPESAEREMKHKQMLIDQILASGNRSFFAKEIQSRMNDPRALKVPAGKPREELTLVELMAVDHCAGFVAPALEYIYRYCSPKLEQQVLPHLTQTQMRLYEALQEKVDHA